MSYFDAIPNSVKQSFSRIRRTSGGSPDSYGDATFTDVTSTGYKGFFQFAAQPGETVILAGKEVEYDAVVFTGSTALIGESDLILYASSTATAISTRYHIKGIKVVYHGTSIDHREVFVSQEVT